MTPTPPPRTRLNRALTTLLLDHGLIIFFVTGLLTGLVSLILSAYQTNRPFFPQDATLWQTYTHDTVPTPLVFIVHYFILTPLIYHLATRTKHPSPTKLALGMPSATMLAVLLVEIGKGYVGRLRPSFASLCLADTPRNIWHTLGPVFSDADCPTLDKAALHDARRSFPSGHAALALCGAAYFQLCLLHVANKVHSVRNRLALYALGWFVLTWAAYVAASRVFDNAHHVGDVAVGSLIGLWTAAVHFWFVVIESDREHHSDKEQ